jgi:transcriptional regulator with XRE-family HTH domain
MGTFGGWLREQRSERKLTREQFARRVGCSVAMLRKIEDDERRPSAQIDELIANALDIPTAERDTFIRVARGELGLERLAHISNVIPHPNISPAEANPHNNLPILPTPLIGRQREVKQLTRLLCDPQCRLLSLVGPGGIGKTRLAVAAAAQVEEVFANGVYFAHLASVSCKCDLFCLLWTERSQGAAAQLFAGQTKTAGFG